MEQKMKTMIIFKGSKKIPKSDFPKNVVLTVSMKRPMKRPMNSNLMNRK